LALAEAERKRRFDFQDKQSLQIYKDVGLKVLKKLKKIRDFLCEKYMISYHMMCTKTPLI